MLRFLVLTGLLVVGGCGSGGMAEPDASGGEAGTDAPASCDFQAGWAEAPGLPLGPTQETAAVAVDGKVYVIGGFSASGGVLRSVQVFDTASCTWSEGPELPRAVHHANAAAVGGTIYVLGSLEGTFFNALGEVWAWNPATDGDWSTLPSMPAGTERGSSIVGVIGDRIYLAGGFRQGAAVTDVSSFHLGTNTWESDLPSLPEPRDHGCGGVVGDKLYVTGGRRGTVQSISGDVFEYTPGTGWVTRAPMPTPRGGTGCGVLDGRIIVVGGEGNPDEPTGVFAEVEAYSPADDAWETLAPMRTPRHGMGAAAWGNSLYVPGGATEEFFAAVDAHEVLTF